ncbi:hypothetical protein RJ640_023266 [Escallonia rubra]|uniref:Uncharacterized protein n=1 Tax=Escallonia rubra TaxID=112253 RepID=A0AA88RXZ9_9ASTE|nr:hypothetical protein RJ640_023266 [Escallonia rubra]
MAASEARASWRRITNQGFVQEDSSRAPKSSLCTSSSSKLESDSSTGDAAKGSEHSVPGFRPYNQNSLSSALPFDNKKWWLHLQPYCGHLKDFSHEQSNALEEEYEILSVGSVNQFSGEGSLIEDYDIQSYFTSEAGSLVNQSWKAFPSSMKNDQDDGGQKLKDLRSGNLQAKPTKKDMGDFLYAGDDLADLDPYKSFVSEEPNKLCSDMEAHWIGDEKTEQWWRTSDKDELASFVSHKSLEYFENCDLPRPQSKQRGKGSYACPQCSDEERVLASLDLKEGKETSSVLDCTEGSFTSETMSKTQCTLGVEGCPRHGSHSATKGDNKETMHSLNCDLSTAQLIEALCHSQSRAREAEKAAQEAYEEKEHIIKLLLRQASQLFAYKHWFQLLQLQTLGLQVTKKDQPVSTCFPPLGPAVPGKGRQPKKHQSKAVKKGLGQPGHKLRASAVAFAVGLSLAGAGLLLGWTTGWLFPAF